MGGGGHRTRGPDVPLGVDGRRSGRGPASPAPASPAPPAGEAASGAGPASPTPATPAAPATPRPPVALLGSVPPSVLVLTGVAQRRLETGKEARLFTQIPPAAVTGLRLWTAAEL